MRGLNRYISLGISALLLLCFSVTILPLDLYHDHASEVSSKCQDAKSGKQCEHKYHVSQKTKPCWLCAIHYDKTFISQTETDSSTISPTLASFYENEVTSYFTKLIFSCLRGPPAE